MTINEAEAKFRALCAPTSLDDLRRLAARVETHAQVVVERNLTDSGAQAALAEDLSTVLRRYIQRAAELTADQRSKLRGAIEYFLLTSDVDDDLAAGGMEDDRVVVELLTSELHLP